ncbi:hypothetical protein QN219_25425 [Sinorhizobium sp. 7-81]|uniref:hypothetical protein n=1 Tax=Sinorhizobium sp. 8-89 TaxID=3049089 RepID=UPI0024C29EC4|nr:hypothetical protein [Sinorhizobium sp. 8-89]MDK1493349.1 hypothetical protein [Sinorhizobium sp. 8-89]
MTKRAPIKQADLNRLAAVVKRNNITVEVEAEGYTIRMSPGSPAAVAPLPEPEPELDTRWDIPWADIPPEPIQPPLNWRESKAMDYLVERGAEVRVDWYMLKDFGTHTQKKLQERGFIEASSETDRHGHPDEVWLTRAGAKAMRDQRSHRDKYPCF